MKHAITEELLESYIKAHYFLSMYSVIRQAYFDQTADVLLKRFKVIVKTMPQDTKDEWRVFMENKIPIIRAEVEEYRAAKKSIELAKGDEYHASGKRKVRKDANTWRIPDYQ